LNSGLSTDFGVQLKFWLSKLAQRKSKSKSKVTQCLSPTAALQTCSGATSIVRMGLGLVIGLGEG